MTTALIDGDILVYSVGFACEDKTENEVLVEMDSKLDEITFNCGCSESVIYLSDASENNFRKKIYPAYKANRKQPKPKHYTALRNYLIKVEQAVVALGQEADDALSIAQYKAMKEHDGTWFEGNWDTTIICSLDKDLLMVEGWHYNWRRDETVEVTKEEGLRNFYRQLLTGDTVDNIPGLHGIGPVKANAMLAGCFFEDEYNKVVLAAYKEYFPHCSEAEVINHINIIGRLLYIRRKEGEEWSFAMD